MHKRLSFVFTAALVAGMSINSSSAYAADECAIAKNDGGTYAGPVTAVITDVADTTEFRVSFQVKDDSKKLWERHTVSATRRASFRVSRSYAVVTVIGFAKDGTETCTAHETEYVIAGGGAKGKAKSERRLRTREGRKVINGLPATFAQRHMDETSQRCTGPDGNNDGIGDLCETVGYKGWINLADARDVEVRARQAESNAAAHANSADAALEQRVVEASKPSALHDVGAGVGLGTLGGAVVCGIASIATSGLALTPCVVGLAVGGGTGGVIGTVVQVNR